MKQAVLFDLDNTLLDRAQSLIQFARQQHRKHEPLQVVPQVVYVERFVALDDNGRVWKDKVYQQLLAELNVTMLSWETLLQDYVETFRHACVGFPGLTPMLDALCQRGLPLGLITNGRSPFQENNIDALGIIDYFQTILVSEAEGVRKPDAQIFQRALHRLDVAASEAVFVGDNPTADVAGAQAVGMKAIWRYCAQHPSCKFADAVCHELSELPSLIQELNKHELPRHR